MGAAAGEGEARAGPPVREQKLPKKIYKRELRRLQEQLVVMTEWVRHSGARVAVVFEGRDAAGKGGAIQRITEHVSPRVARVVALPKPTERERSQWYFQRYIEHLPAGGEVVLFDRSWYNRAGVEKVMGFCTPEEHRRFLHQAPLFERMLVDDGIFLVKYWFSVSDAEQQRRFEKRIENPLKHWKLSPMDLESIHRWVDFSRAKDEMFVHTDIPEARWNVVESDIKRNARINCISHLLEQVPYEQAPREEIELPARQSDAGYERPDREIFDYVPDRAGELIAATEGD
jgi:polyphosphate kinase